MASAASFRVGDKVVYPNHGVGVIEHISRGMGEPAREFYQLRIEASNLRVMVPLDCVGQVGMRAIISRAELEGILDYLQCGDACACATDWKNRFKDNSDKMRSGCLVQVAEVLKSLVQLHNSKPLSFREKKMLDRAATLLAAEWASACAITAEEALARLQQALAKAHLTLPPLDEVAS